MDLKKIVYKVKEFLYKLWYKGHAVVDVPDSRDWLAKPIEVNLKGFKNKWDLLPDRYFALELADRLGVKYKWQTDDNLPNGCTIYNACYTKKTMQSINQNKAVELDEKKMWHLHIDLGRGDPRSGGTLQNALKTLLEYPNGNPIAGYFRIKPNRNIKDVPFEVCARIIRNQLVYTGVRWRGSNWRDLIKTGIYRLLTGRAFGGHAISLLGYDKIKEEVYVWQSIKKVFGKNREGMFIIPFDELKNTMSIYALQDFEYKID